MNKFYVYLHLKNDDKTPFYVGKGFGNRAYRKVSRNPWWKNTVNKHGYEVQFIETNLSEDYAFELEKHFIKKIGRKDLGLGPLVNLTDGGQGPSGLRFEMSDESKLKISKASKSRMEVSEATREKISKAHKGKIVSSETREKISRSKSGKKHTKPMSDEAKLKLSESRKGIKFSDETRKKMSISATKRKTSDETKKKISDSMKNRKGSPKELPVDSCE